MLNVLGICCKIWRSLLSFLQFFWLSNWKNSELSRVLNMRPRQFNFYSCILKSIFFPSLHLRALNRNFQFCTIFSAYLPICWVSQQLPCWRNQVSKSLCKNTNFFIYAKCKHNVHSTIRGFSLLYHWPFLELSEVWNRLFLHFSCLKSFFLYLIALLIP